MSSSTIATSFWDSAYLDEYTIPLGEWVQDLINWIVNNLGWLLDAIEWPIDRLLFLIYDSFLQRAPWPVIVVLTMLIGWRTRNFRVGVLAGAGLIVCGLLGEGFWDDTMLTIGMILTAVIICVVIGLPMGIAAARSDRFAALIRPGLDAMQTVHPFVWLVPVVFFFGIRQVPGVIATIIFALPPIVRLTDLGIRQVPADVVEAARAYGSSERQLLFQVQLPLARRTIMAGLNQTLLLALSMVVIAALLAAGGLGQQILRGVQNLDIPLAVSAGTAVLIVAIILDRLSQIPSAEDAATDGPTSRGPGPVRRLLARLPLAGRRDDDTVEEVTAESDSAGADWSRPT